MISILIPARNEKYLQQTIDDIRANATDVEILVGLDGWDTPITDADYILRTEVAIGQRAMTNELARKATQEIVMKVDAHCSFSREFDRAMLQDFEPDMTLSPAMMNLDPETWEIRAKPVCAQYVFDTNLIFQYGKENLDILSETMCLQGSAWMCTKERYFALNLSGEEFGSWGQQGVELGVKTWNGGGRCMTTKNAYYGHWFRPADGFPYENTKEAIDHAIETSRKLFYPKVGWLVEKFNYPADWTPEKVKTLCT